MNKQTNSLVVNLDTDIAIERKEQMNLYIDLLLSKGYEYHHTAIRNGYAPIGGNRKPIWAFIKQYKGRFGEGVLVCEHRNYDTVYCHYYLK